MSTIYLGVFCSVQSWPILPLAQRSAQRQKFDFLDESFSNYVATQNDKMTNFGLEISIEVKKAYVIRFGGNSNEQ
jgi:hypothetical protein